MLWTDVAAPPEKPAPAPTDRVRPANRRRRRSRARTSRAQWRAGYLLTAPAVLAITIFFFVPMLYSLYWSLTDYNGITAPKWVGTHNYTDVLSDPLFRKAWRNTAVYAVITMSVGPALGLASALLLNQKIKARGLFRAAYFLPVTTSLVVVATIWKLLLNDQGLLNRLLALVGITGHDWLSDPSTSLLSVSAASIWQGFGFETVVFLAALQTVSRDLYDAARVDGAGARRLFWHVTLPAIRPTLIFVYIVGLIGAFQAFDQMYVMTNGGPIESTSTVVYYLVDRFRALDLGHASAAAYLLVLVLGGVAALLLRLGRDTR